MLVWGVQRDLGSLAGSSFDVLVVGGGIVGACVARDAALRGLRVALIERGDFGGGISWNSLKIVHGGLRSLQGLDIRQARHFVRERRAWLRIAPHLVEPLSFVVPTRGIGRESAFVMRAGLALNDLVSSDRNEGVVASRQIAAGRALSRDEMRALVPGVVDDYTGGALFHDAQLYSAERLVMAVLEDAVRAGATIANYVECVGPMGDGGVRTGVSAHDALGGESGERFDVRAAMIVNATGASAATVADRLTGREGSATAMHGIALNLMLAGDDSTKAAVAITASEEGRMRRLFVVPWRGRTLVGTAHYPCERMPESSADLEPFVERFVREVRSAWPARAVTRASVLLVHAGMQPLPHGAPGAKHGPPEHSIIDHARDGAPQLLTAIGPKFTTSRAVAQELVDLVAARVGKATRSCETATRPLASAPADDVAITIARALAGDRAGIPDDMVTHLVRSYGAGYDALLALVRERSVLGARIESDSPVIAAQLEHAVRNEMAMRADDLVDRRTELGATARATSRARRRPELRAAIDEIVGAHRHLVPHRMLELGGNHRRITLDARTEHASLAYERQQRIVAGPIAAHEVRHHIVGYPRTIARQRARDRDRDIVGRRRRERARRSLARPGRLPDSRRNEIHQLLGDRPRRRELGPDRRQQLRRAIARVIDDRVFRRPVLRARCTVRQRLHPRVHEQHTRARDCTRRPRRAHLAHEALDEGLEIRARFRHPLARVVRGADEGAPSPRDHEEPAHSPLFARRDCDGSLRGIVAREHEIERDAMHRGCTALSPREPIRNRGRARARGVHDHRRSHIEALAALTAERIVRGHARAHATIAHRPHALHVVRDRRARAHRILEHRHHEALGRVELRVVKERATGVVVDDSGHEGAHLIPRQGAAGRNLSRCDHSLISIRRDQIVEREPRAHHERGLAPDAACRHHERKWLDQMRRNPEPRAPLAHEVARLPNVEPLQRPQPAVHDFEAVPRDPAAEVSPLDQRHSQPAQRRIAGYARTDDPPAHDEDVEAASGQ